MASVSVDDVRDVINISSAEVPDFKITNMIKRAEVTLELETDKQIDYGNCTDAEKKFITVLAAIYVNCLVKISVVGEVASPILGKTYRSGYKLAFHSLCQRW